MRKPVLRQSIHNNLKCQLRRSTGQEDLIGQNLQSDRSKTEMIKGSIPEPSTNLSRPVILTRNPHRLPSHCTTALSSEMVHMSDTFNFIPSSTSSFIRSEGPSLYRGYRPRSLEMDGDGQQLVQAHWRLPEAAGWLRHVTLAAIPCYCDHVCPCGFRGPTGKKPKDVYLSLHIRAHCNRGRLSIVSQEQ